MVASIDTLRKYTKNPEVRKFLDLLAYTEGTDRAHGYNTLVGGKKIDDLSAHPNVVGLKTKDGSSTAFGRYQITGTTWRGLQKKYGFSDFSPETQDLAAIALLKDAGALGAVLKGDLKTGADKVKNIWVSLPGSSTTNQPEKTQSEVDKFLGGQDTSKVEGMFNRIKAEVEKTPSSQLDNIYQAYKSKKMSPKERAEFEEDVATGALIFPSHIARTITPPKKAAARTILPIEVVNAYNNGVMSSEERLELEQDIKNKMVSLPKGVTLLSPGAEPTFTEKALNLFTGELQQTDETRSLPSWEEMPSMQAQTMEGFKTRLGNAISSKDEAVKIWERNNPGGKVSTDSKGNYLLTDPIDGKTYVIPPGVSATDIINTIGLGFLGGAALPTTGTVLGAAALGAGSQTAIEATQKALGGSFNVGDIATAGVLGGGVQGVLNAASNPLKAAVAKVTRRGTPSTLNTPTPTPTPTPQAPQLSSRELVGVTNKATSSIIGRGSAKKLAEQVAPDLDVVNAAKALGVEDYLQPHHTSTNQAYKELARGIAPPGSKTYANEVAGLQRIAKRADDIIDELGTQDLSELNVNVRTVLENSRNELRAQAKGYYDQVDAVIPKSTKIDTTNLKEYLTKRIEDVGGVERLEPGEKEAMKLIKFRGEKRPTYGGLDSLRKQINSVKFGSVGVFAETTDVTRDNLLKAMRADQKEVATSFGVGDVWELAQKASKAKKDVQDNLKTLFGEALDRSFTPALATSVKALPAGDPSKLITILKAVPDDQKKEVVAGGLLTAFGKTAKNGDMDFATYTKWFEGLQRNKQSYTAIMTNLPKESVEQLKNLYKVSKGVASSYGDKASAAGASAVREQFRASDTFLGNIYRSARRAYLGVAAETITTPLGAPGAGLTAGIVAALNKGRTKAIQAADDLISSPEFLDLVKKVNSPEVVKSMIKSPFTSKEVQKMAKSKTFINYLKSINVPHNPQSARVKYLILLLQGANNKRNEENANKR